MPASPEYGKFAGFHVTPRAFGEEERIVFTGIICWRNEAARDTWYHDFQVRIQAWEELGSKVFFLKLLATGGIESRTIRTNM